MITVRVSLGPVLHLVFLIAACTPTIGQVITAGLDLNDPVQAMHTWVRLKGDTAGRVTYEWVVGTVYGVPVDEASRALFGVESLTVRQTRSRGDDSYEERSFSCRLYKDAVTGEYIDRFDNPYTERTVNLKPSCSNGLPLRLSSAGMEVLSEIQLESTALDRPMTLQLVEANDHVIIRRDVHSTFVLAGAGEVRREMSVDTFKLKAEDLNNLELTSLFPAYSWVGNTQWMSIFEMADTPGHMIWSINGRKYLSSDELPAAFRGALERYVPGALNRAIEWD